MPQVISDRYYCPCPIQTRNLTLILALTLKRSLFLRDDVKNQRRFFESLRVTLGLESMDDWYSVSAKDILSQRGSAFIREMYHSVTSALLTVYSDYDWKPWCFRRVPPGIFNRFEL